MILDAEEISLARGSEFCLQIPRIEFSAGQVYGLVGPNGAGKSTFLQVLALLETPDSGMVRFKGKVAMPNTSAGLEARQHMTMVMENPLLFRGTVRLNLLSGLRFHRVPRHEWASRIKQALELVGLPSFADRKASQLSRGETQRIAIARAMVIQPEVLLLDEPFAHVDRTYVRALETLIPRINRELGTTVIFTTHDLLQAYRLAGEVISLVEGKLVNGSLENLFTGEIQQQGDAQWVEISPSIRIDVVTSLTGLAHITIPPRDIILSCQPFDSSARNSFQGQIRQIQLDEGVVRVTVDIAERVSFIAVITRASLATMHLIVGMSVYLTFKSTAVTVF